MKRDNQIFELIEKEHQRQLRALNLSHQKISSAIK